MVYCILILTLSHYHTINYTYLDRNLLAHLKKHANTKLVIALKDAREGQLRDQ